MRDAEESLRLAREIGDQKLQAQTLIHLGRTLQWRADFDRSLTHLQEGVELVQRMHMGFMFGQAAFFMGHSYLAKGEYEEALRWYRQFSEYASAAGDKFHIARAPNCIGGVYLELFDLGEAIQVNLEAEEVARKTWPWPEPRGHCLVKAGLAYLLQDERDLAEECFRRAWALLEADTWMRWRWHIPLLRARGEFALAEGRHDEAWTYATQSLEMATQTNSRKHIARAQWLQGEVLAAGGRLEEAVQALEASVRLAESLQIPREVWMGKSALGKVLTRMGKDKEAEAQFAQAVKVIETIAEKLRTPRLHQSFLGAEPVLEVYRVLGRRPPLITAN
jgi:tetratricopeptide (TPR) repeat protein